MQIKKEFHHTFFSDLTFAKCSLRSFCRELLVESKREVELNFVLKTLLEAVQTSIVPREARPQKQEVIFLNHVPLNT